jgi:hypothetical protein
MFHINWKPLTDAAWLHKHKFFQNQTRSGKYKLYFRENLFKNEEEINQVHF